MRYFIPFCLALFSCASYKNPCTPFKEENNSNKATIQTLTKTDQVEASFNILSVNISGNQLILLIATDPSSHASEFILQGDAVISKSLPPIRTVRLSNVGEKQHERTDQTKWKNLTLTFDISDLAYKQESGSEIYLKLEGANERILYTYK
jgi:hypothetical protein